MTGARAWLLSAVLFAATVASVVAVRGPRFAVALLAILLAHEFGHYFAARAHGIVPSPPLFIPFPWGILGTMGAVIVAPPRIERRAQLFDFAIAGPLAGLVIALPLLVVGMMQSEVGPAGHGVYLEGRSLLYLAIRTAVHGPLDEGEDVNLDDLAFAGWTGLLVTMLNLVPIGQLDGGHVAYALLGRAQDLWSRRFLRALPFVAVTVGAYEAAVALRAHAPWSEVWSAAALGLNWLVWYAVLRLLARGTGDSHPATDAGELGPVRRALGWFTLALFPLLFMPWFMRVIP